MFGCSKLQVSGNENCLVHRGTWLFGDMSQIMDMCYPCSPQAYSTEPQSMEFLRGFQWDQRASPMWLSLFFSLSSNWQITCIIQANTLVSYVRMSMSPLSRYVQLLKCGLVSLSNITQQRNGVRFIIASLVSNLSS